MFKALYPARWRYYGLLYYYRRRYHKLKCKLLTLYHKRHRFEAKQRAISERILTLQKSIQQKRMQ